MKNIQQTWATFATIFSDLILPIYKNHEKTFDGFGLHGRRHVTRSLIFAELMTRYYYSLGEKEIDFYGIRAAVAFHDTGRQGNGKDIWEGDSAKRCAEYLQQQGKSVYYAKTIAGCIEYKKADVCSRSSQIIYDTDVIEILRLFVGSKNGLKKLRREEFLFLNHPPLKTEASTIDFPQIRNQFIYEAWTYIHQTEKLGKVLKNDQFLTTYINIILGNEKKYPLLNQLFKLI